MKNLVNTPEYWKTEEVASKQLKPNFGSIYGQGKKTYECNIFFK